MLIRFSKSRNGPVLSCIREDGSVTGVKPRHGEFFVRHDLMHYAVESTLGLSDAFYGLIAKGRTIESFNAPGSAKTLPANAVRAEFIVGLLDQAIAWNQTLEADHFNEQIEECMAAGAVPPPASRITQAQLDAIVKLFRDLYTQYAQLDIGRHLEVEFPRAAE